MSQPAAGSTLLAELLRHHRWANLVLIDACAEVADTVMDRDVEAAYGVPRATLMHLVSAEEGYVRLLGHTSATEPLDEDAGFPGYAELRARAAASGDALVALASALDPEATWLQPRDDDGTRYTAHPAVPLIQAVNHGAEHREQIKHALSVAGIAPPRIDAWGYAFAADLMRVVD